MVMYPNCLSVCLSGSGDMLPLEYFEFTTLEFASGGFCDHIRHQKEWFLKST